MQLSEHFSLDEFTASQVASRKGLSNVPGPAELVNLTRLAAAMEQVRTLLGQPIHVDSAYRSPEVNAAVGGVATSAHCKGLACDFVCPEFGTPYAVACAIRDSGILFDQLLREYGWVHLAGPEQGAVGRQECLTKESAAAPWEKGIVP